MSPSEEFLQKLIENPASTDAEIYVAMARIVLESSIIHGWEDDPNGIRRWWIKEEKRRKKYGLSPEQEQEIIDMCKVTVSLLPDPEPRKLDHNERRRLRRR